MATYNVSVLVGRGTRIISDTGYTSRNKASAAFHKAAAQYISDTDASVSLSVLRHACADYKSYGTIAVKYTDATRVELTPMYYATKPE